jgi:hypothetical protein
MTKTQQQAMAILNRNNASAIHTKLGWTWKQDVRELEEAARAVIEAANV